MELRGSAFIVTLPTGPPLPMPGTDAAPTRQ